MNNIKFSNILKKLGKNIELIRTKQNLTIKEISERTGIRKIYLHEIEKGNAIGIKTTQLFKIANTLTVNIQDLLKE